MVEEGIVGKGIVEIGIDEVTIQEVAVVGVVKVVEVVKEKWEARLEEEVKWSSWAPAVELGRGRMESHFVGKSVESDCRFHACVVQAR